MTTETRYPYAKAHALAERIKQLLAPHCEKFHVAGSLRRMKAEVKDIEVVCIPKKEQRSVDLFGGTKEIICNGFSFGLTEIMEEIVKGKITGRYMQVKLKGDMMLDLFLPHADDYYRQLAIRTGSADYSHQVIAKAWYKKGWCGTADGLRKQTECTGGGKYPWKCKKEKPTLPPSWKTEGEFFTWLGLEYIDPEFREVHNPINTAQ
jgi:DNA polymerase/3'-5' exonuclease PolX